MLRRLTSYPRSREVVFGSIGAATLSVACRFSSTKDFYKVLGVEKTATQQDIKKAYRKRAMETHPDQGGKKEDFAQVAEAYEVLSNQEKRQVYDNHGAEAVNSMGQGGFPGGAGGRTAEDIFSEFFKAQGMGGFGMDGGREQRAQVAPVEANVNLTLEEVYAGASKKVKFTRPMTCSECRGHGTKNKQPKPKCTQCHGSGQQVTQHRMGPGMVQQVLSECPRCHGSGATTVRGEECLSCSGNGYKNEAAEISVPIPAGVPDGVTMALRGEGGTIPKAEPGDLHVNVKTQQHAVFTRRGNDLIVNKEISLSEALTGVSVPLTLLDGRHICVTGPKGQTLQHGAVLKVGGEGIPSHSGSARGDLYVFISVALPKSITSEQEEALVKAFGRPATPPASHKAVPGKVLRESKEQLKEMKEAQWAAQEVDESRRGGGGRARRGRGGGEQQQQCHAQ
jgi:molecular chaperone DnaJ